MTSGELMRTARKRAGLSQSELAESLRMPRSQIARWEADVVDPGFATTRRVLRACGFDLSSPWCATSPMRSARRACASFGA